MNFYEWYEKQPYGTSRLEDMHQAWMAAMQECSERIVDFPFLQLLKISDEELKLMAGEMTAQELRTVRAVMNGILALHKEYEAKLSQPNS